MASHGVEPMASRPQPDLRPTALVVPKSPGDRRITAAPVEVVCAWASPATGMTAGGAVTGSAVAGTGAAVAVTGAAVVAAGSAGARAPRLAAARTRGEDMPISLRRRPVTDYDPG